MLFVLIKKREGASVVPGSFFRCLDLLIGKSPLNSCKAGLGEKEAPTSLGWCLGQ